MLFCEKEGRKRERVASSSSRKTKREDEVVVTSISFLVPEGTGMLLHRVRGWDIGRFLVRHRNIALRIGLKFWCVPIRDRYNAAKKRKVTHKQYGHANIKFSSY